jgi:hypothetical protein
VPRGELTGRLVLAHTAAANTTIGASGLTFRSVSGSAAPDDFRLRQRFGATVRLPGYTGGTGQDAGSLAQVVAYIQGQNTWSAGEPGSAAQESVVATPEARHARGPRDRAERPCNEGLGFEPVRRRHP